MMCREKIFFSLTYIVGAFLLAMIAGAQEPADTTQAPAVIEEVATVTLELAQAQEPAVESEEAKQAAWEAKLKTMTLEERLSQPISLDLRNMDVNDALKYLATKGGLNIITTKNVGGRISFTLNEVPLKDVFDLMLRSNGLAYSKEGEIYNVMTELEYKALYGKSFFDIRQVKVFRLKYAIPEQAFTMLDALKSEIGRVLVDTESGSVMLMDTPDRIAMIDKAMAEFEKENVVQVFPLKYAQAKEVEDILKTRLDNKKVGSVIADERNNQLIVQTLPYRMHEIANLIAELDKQTKQVLIDTKIIKIKLSDKLDSGAEWEGIFKVAESLGMNYVGSSPFSAVQGTSDPFRTRQQVLDDLGGAVGSYPFSGTTSDFAGQKTALGENMHYGIVSNALDFDVVMNFLQTLGETRVLSNPKIVVVNNQEAKIHVGERQAYVTSTTTQGQATSTVAEEVHFEEVGIKLAVTPFINDDGYIIMKVRPEISAVSQTLITPTKNRIPIVDAAVTETTVMMKDGTTLIIGGLRKQEMSLNRRSLPLIAKIPILKSLFGSGDSQTDRTELLVMMTPHIISGQELTTGDRRGLGDKPGKEYQDYPVFIPGKEEIPAGTDIKPYQDYLSLRGEESFPIKDEK
jgi:type II secretory pathway component GspD/PulD (secretin)